MKDYLDDDPYRETCDTGTARREVGRDFAKAGRIEDAIKIFREARSLDPTLEFDPITEAADFFAQSLIEKGRSLLRKHNPEEALLAFQEAQGKNPKLVLDPKAELARYFVKMAKGHFGKKEYDEAKNRLDQALTFNPKLGEEPYFGINNYWFQLVLTHLKGGSPESAIAALKRVKRIKDKQPSISVLNQICLLSSLKGIASEVMDICDDAVKLVPEYGNLRLSRAIARALTNDLNWALEDLRFYIDGSGGSGNIYAQEKSWITSLESGENPFTPEVCKKLYDDYKKNPKKLLLEENYE